MSDGLEVIEPTALHVCIDMQNLFAPGAPWAAPWFDRVLPRIVALVAARPERTLFTRFIPVRRPDDAAGRWRRYFEAWRELTLERMDPHLLELPPELGRFVPPAGVLDKHAYSPFHGTGLAASLRERKVTLIVSGTETDICVLAAVLDAVDAGFRVVVARDAICSSNDGTHDALLKLYHERFSHQVEVAEVAEILAAWARD